MRKNDLDKTKKFHLVKSQIPGVVKKFIKKEHILYGGKAINQQVLPHLKIYSKDFDIFSKNPKDDAIKLERLLDKKAGADIFTIKKAKHPGTYKVKDLRGETVADFTQMPSKIKVRNILGRNMESIDSMAPKIKKTLSNPINAYRKEKDLDNLNRIILMKKIRSGLST